MPEKVPLTPDDEVVQAATHGEIAGEGGVEDTSEPDLAVLGPQLRGLYKGLLDEPIPDRFLQLLNELERKEADKS
ncbi:MULTISPECIES: NepR family anti-sigma factor [Rhodomicrobium]|uniref:NepR family anti-sigma factor n=1 Tax=Rhodomicrobium TaxID=1068 RepID=UPI000F74A05B|nr:MULTISPECIES: NepR family anti-sigma factor [Rhodomicrobium]